MMKNKIFAFAAVISLLSAVSCSEEKLYTPAEPVSADCQCVYFSSENASDYVWPSTDDIATMYIPYIVCREKSDKAASVPVSVTGDVDMFDIPATAEFAAGESKTEFLISVKEVVPGGYSLDLSIVGDEFLNPYAIVDGSPMGTINVDLEQWESWAGKNTSELYGKEFDVIISHKVGTNEYAINSLWGGVDPGFTIYDNGNGYFSIPGLTDWGYTYGCYSYSGYYLYYNDPNCVYYTYSAFYPDGELYEGDWYDPYLLLEFYDSDYFYEEVVWSKDDVLED